MSLPPVSFLPFDGSSVCLFCGASETADPSYTEAAYAFGKAAAEAGWRLVYGGGGVGLMGASARGAHEAGGRVVGIMPAFLRSRERLFDEVETVVVTSMHERKQLMYDQSDAFVVAPGGIGTLEEVVELLSWKRLDLHHKPVVFLNLDLLLAPPPTLAELLSRAKYDLRGLLPPFASAIAGYVLGRLARLMIKRSPTPA